MKGRNIDLELDREGRSEFWAATVGLIGWISANLAAKRTRKRLGKERSMVVRYDNLIRSPESELCRIIKRAGLSSHISTSLEKKDEFEIGHLVGGNRMARENKKIQIDSSKSPSNRLSKVENLLVRGLSSPIEMLVQK